MSLFPRSTGPRSTSIGEAVRDMEFNGDNISVGDGRQYAPTPHPPQEEYGMGMYGMAPPTQPAPNQLPVYHQQQTYYEPSTYLFISYNAESETTKVEVMDEASIMAKLDELGLERSLTAIPTGNPAHWGGKFLIIKGSVVVPKEVRTIKLV